MYMLNLQKVIRKSNSIIGYNNDVYNKIEKKSIELKSSSIKDHQTRLNGLGWEKWTKDNNIKININLNLNDFIKSKQLITGTVLLECFTSEFVLLHLKVALLGVEEMVGNLQPITHGFLLKLGNVIDHDKQILEHFDRYGSKKPIIEIPFQLQLPADIPSSFKHPWATIRYFLFCQAKVRYLNTGQERCLVKEMEIKIINSSELPENSAIIGEYYNKNIMFNPFEGFNYNVIIPTKCNLSGLPIKLRISGSNIRLIKIKQLDVILTRNITILKSDLVNVSKSISNIIYKNNIKNKMVLSQLNSPTFEFLLNFNLPANLKSITNSFQIQVNYCVQVKIRNALGFYADLQLPIVLVHPASIEMN